MMYQRGDVISVPFPFTDLSQTKLRPALVISNSIVNDTGDVIIVMITSKQNGKSFCLPIEKDSLSSALPKDSFVNCHKLVTISTFLIRRKISHATPYFIDSVVNNIKGLIEDLEFTPGLSVGATI